MSNTKEEKSGIDYILEEKKFNGVKKTKTPRQYDSILKGALALELKDRVELKRELTQSIETEVKDLREKAQFAEALAKE